MATIRHADLGDASAIAALWNHIIRDTLVTFATAEKPVSEVARLIGEREGCFFVAEQAEFLGFATIAQFRGGTGYAHTMEHTVLLAPGARRLGIGRRLIEAVCEEARARGAHVMVAAITSSNEPALAFHAALRFQEVARMPEVGRKFGGWHDLVLMQRRL